MTAQLRVTYVKSAIGRAQVQKDTVKALGLRRLNQTTMLPDNPSVRGMVQKIPHLLQVEEVEEQG